MNSIPFYIQTLLFLLLFSNCNSSNKEIGSPIQDHQGSSENTSPAFNKELIIDIKGDSVAGYAFIASGEMLKKTVLLIAGYPGNDNNFDIAQELRRNGINVIHFNHRGAWGSQGKYNYSNCLEDINEIIKYLSQDKVSKKLKIKTDEFILLGRSFGGGIALISGSQNSSVEKIIAISSVNYGMLMEGYDNLSDLSNFKKYMQKQIMMNHDIDEFLQELLDKKNDFNILTYKDQLLNKKVLLIEDSDKNKNWISKLSNAESIILKSDHNFIDKRIELIDLIINWVK